MKKGVIFDLEGVLVDTIDGNLHPNALEVLSRANRDFNKIGLWTACEFDTAYKCVERLNLLEYFNFIIAQNREYSRNKIVRLKRGQIVSEGHIPWTRYRKDLRLLGDPNDLVLIEDIMVVREDQFKIIMGEMGLNLDEFPIKTTIFKNGYPKNRVIYLKSYKGQVGHSLIKPYEEALRKFEYSLGHI